MSLDFEDFLKGSVGNINFSTFTDFEKAITIEELVAEYPNGDFTLYSERDLQKYGADLSKAIQTAAKADLPAIIEKAKKDLGKLIRKVVTDKNGKRMTVWVRVNKDKTSDKGFANGAIQGINNIPEKKRKEVLGKIAQDYDTLSHINRIRFEREYEKSFGKKFDKKTEYGKGTKGKGKTNAHIYPDHVKKVEAYQKELEELKKIAVGEISNPHGSGHTSSSILNKMNKIKKELKELKEGDTIKDWQGKKKKVDAVSGNRVLANDGTTTNTKKILNDKVAKLVSAPPDDFYEKVAKHFGEPKDDGESEHALYKRIIKNPAKAQKLVDSLGKKGNKGGGSDGYSKIQDIIDEESDGMEFITMSFVKKQIENSKDSKTLSKKLEDAMMKKQGVYNQELVDEAVKIFNRGKGKKKGFQDSAKKMGIDKKNITVADWTKIVKDKFGVDETNGRNEVFHFGKDKIHAQFQTETDSSRTEYLVSVSDEPYKGKYSAVVRIMKYKNDWENTNISDRIPIDYENFDKKEDAINRIKGYFGLEKENAKTIKKSEKIQALRVGLANSEIIQKTVDSGKFESIEKALSSFRYDNNIKFKKTGKQIKEKIEAIEGRVKAKQMEYRLRMSELIKLIGEDPTEPLGEYDTERIGEDQVTGIKRYNWNKEYYDTKNPVTAFGMTDFSKESGKSITGATNEEQAKNVKEYNNLIYKLFTCIEDYKTIETIEHNIDEKQTYELSLNQVKELGF